MVITADTNGIGLADMFAVAETKLVLASMDEIVPSADDYWDEGLSDGYDGRIN